MAEPNASGGQAAANPTGTTVKAPDATGGQSATSSQTTAGGPANGAEDTFLSAFDPKELEGKPELQKAYKQMLGDYRNKTSGIKASEKQLAEYKQLMADPEGAARKFLAEKGYHVVQKDQDGQPKNWEPKTWKDVEDLIQQRAEEIANKQLNPMLKEVSSLKQQSIEARLDSDYSDWRTYEETMVQNLTEHPTLSKNLEMLYRMSVPQEVIEQRAYNKAMAKLKGSSDASQISGAKTTTAQTSQRPEGKLTMDQAWQLALKQVQHTTPS